MNDPHTSYISAHTPRKRKAFALVLSLALMGFMVLLVTTLATMVQQQLRLSRQSLNDFKARQAAKFAAFQAMSRIQETLGPDQRITANAMMFEKQLSPALDQLEQDEKYEWWKNPMQIDREEVENISADDAVSENRNWVGVWFSHPRLQPDKIGQTEKREDYVKRTVDDAVTWLVSGNKIRSELDKTGAHLAHKPTEKLNSGDYVRIVNKGSTAQADDPEGKRGHVLAPLVTLKNDPDPITNEVRDNGKETRIAWWVADEGQKASLNAIASKKYIDLFKTVDYRIQSLPFYSGINGLTLPMSGGAGIKAFDINTDEESGDPYSVATLRNMSDVRQIDILKSENVPANTQLSKLFFHGVTFNTKGLLVNVREGGMKKDLTLGLTRKDFENELEDPGDRINDRAPDYFERPYGTAGYEFKTSAYPLLWSNMQGSKSKPRNQARHEKSKLNKGLGHMFPPQMFVNDDLAGGDYETASTIGEMLNEIYTDKFILKDPGGPLWSQLRSYYNLRAEDDAENGTLKDRVQTDDRFGFKPVVKRFQIFYAPTFVHYGQQRYGVRLHIIPMLVLYNPYDTKIAGDTYYVLQVDGAEMANQNSPGAFRFAVGYKSGNNFQCLRDLRTELIPSLDQQTMQTNETYRRQTYFKLSQRGIWNTGANGYVAPDDVIGYLWEGTANISLTYRRNTNENNDMSTPLPFMQSTKSYFYDQRILPIGYGTTRNSQASYSIAPGVIIPPSNSVRYNAGSTNFGGNIIPSKVSHSTSGYPNDNPSNTESHWKGIVAAGNIVPSLQNAYTTLRMGRTWSGRVAKIPLYLNNLYMTVEHGRFCDTGRGGNTDNANNQTYLFSCQRGLAAHDPNKCDKNETSTMAGDLRFVAYSKKGIEPGRAVVFVMDNIVSYVGDPTGGGSGGNIKKEDIGPNGAVEYKNQDTTPYKDRNALMVPLDEAGNTFGGCFYLDVPHPESEHFAKYTKGETWDYRDERYMNVLFDLNSGSAFSVCNPNYRNDMYDINGNLPPSDISQYYIDIQDVVGWEPGGGARPVNAITTATPLGYGTYAFMPDYDAPGQRQPTTTERNNNQLNSYFTRKPAAAEYHKSLMLSVWIWKREGFKFHELLNNQNNHGGGASPKFSPVLVQMKGYRIFLGNTRQSFPDPTLGYNNYYKSRDAGVGRVNFHIPGFVRGESGTGASSLTTSLRAFGWYYQTDRSDRMETFGPDNKNALERGNEVAYLKYLIDNGETDAYTTQYFRSRYYINWLGINPRRHSANFWLWNGQRKIQDGQDFIGDANPEAVQPISVEWGSDYRNKLHTSLSTVSSNSTKVPYGIIFAQPYAENSIGSQPFFNRRLFVNGDIRASRFGQEFNGRDIENTQDASVSTDGHTIANTLGRISSNAQVSSQIYSASNSTGEGMSDIGYNINVAQKPYAYVGLKDTIGADTAPIHHILRRTEVVSNPANLASANLTYGVGNYGTTTYEGSDRNDGDNEPFYSAYHLGYPDSLIAPFAIGNSLCPSRIVPDRNYHISWLDGANERADDGLNDGNRVTWTKEKKYWNGKRDEREDRYAIYDMSWHLNNVLWDEYFFSTLPYRHDDRNDASRLDPSVAYPLNPRLKYVNPDDEDGRLTLSDLDSAETEDQFDENSSKLWINGPFNVNSTNIDAWKAVLSIHYGEEVKDYSGSSNTDTDKVPFARWAAPYKAESFEAGDQMDAPKAMTGYRALTEDEIEKLACAIVEHVKDRGPFYSMSHFVNRVTSNTGAQQRFTDSLQGQNTQAAPLPFPDEKADRNNLQKEFADNGGTHKITHMQKGVLQAAIDSTDINSSFHEDELCIKTGVNGRNMTDAIKTSDGYDKYADAKKVWENWRGAIGPQATGAPTYLMQQDILAKIGSFLTVRSDTFKIRAYGEVKNSLTGNIEGKAWCEMVVQRMPEYIDPDGGSSTEGQKPTDTTGREAEIGYQDDSTVTSKRDYLNEMTSQLSELNKALGRRFKVVSFRWLNDSEI